MPSQAPPPASYPSASSYPTSDLGAAIGVSSVTLAISEEYVGAVLGRSGAVIGELQKVSGARIQVQGKG